MDVYEPGRNLSKECDPEDLISDVNEIEKDVNGIEKDASNVSHADDLVLISSTSSPQVDVRSKNLSSAILKAGSRVRKCCHPHGLIPAHVPLAFTFMAILLTFMASWSCQYFSGANIGFIGTSYGLWTVQDVAGKCQLWDTLFFSYHLDYALVAARALSMSAMVLGLALFTTISLAAQCHILTWGFGVMVLVPLFVSHDSGHAFNIWIVFWLFTYVMLILIARALFIHPVHRRITERGVTYIVLCLTLCMTFTMLTLVVLSSKYCTCDSLSEGDLENRVVGNPCTGQCSLQAGGYLMIVSSVLWIAAAVAVFKIGIQPDEIHLQDAKASDEMYQGFVPKPIASSISDHSIEKEPQRHWLKRLCCDFRVTERSRREVCLFWLFRALLTLIVLMYVFILIILIGSRIENDNASRAPDTTPNFILDPVCAFNATVPSAPFVTFPSADTARQSNMTIAHCGPCGYCSNMDDVETYVKTRKTIAQSAKQCGAIAALGSYDALLECLEEKIDFSPECTVCWADNMKSTAAHCMFTCMKTLFTGFMSSNNVANAGEKGWLNQCLQCDEKMSGTAFVKCSGVARRRLGIASEIERNPEEQCSTVGVDWLTYFVD